MNCAGIASEKDEKSEKYLNFCMKTAETLCISRFQPVTRHAIKVLL